ncbi:hypothetical protein DPEC_G00195760 [Dallia pectoralis]|uniref:Uncharacterized protein n=1 Tax=Dallia pectoralis TaxID=75939 RepID=A0ACC2G7E6_DALPE|nr:hypothetical protein DPEC_G00195760 [Dallia pectoralis]
MSRLAKTQHQDSLATRPGTRKSKSAGSFRPPLSDEGSDERSPVRHKPPDIPLTRCRPAQRLIHAALAGVEGTEATHGPVKLNTRHREQRGPGETRRGLVRDQGISQSFEPQVFTREGLGFSSRLDRPSISMSCLSHPVLQDRRRIPCNQHTEQRPVVLGHRAGPEGITLSKTTQIHPPQ